MRRTNVGFSLLETQRRERQGGLADIGVPLLFRETFDTCQLYVGKEAKPSLATVDKVCSVFWAGLRPSLEHLPFSRSRVICQIWPDIVKHSTCYLNKKGHQFNSIVSPVGTQRRMSGWMDTLPRS